MSDDKKQARSFAIDGTIEDVEIERTAQRPATDTKKKNVFKRRAEQFRRENKK